MPQVGIVVPPKQIEEREGRLRIVTRHLSRARPGEVDNGDAVVVRSHNGQRLIAVIDALGHGTEAALTAGLAVAYLEQVPIATPLMMMMHELHRALVGSRGAAVLLMHYSDAVAVSGCGIGNVGLRCVGSKVPAMLGPGIVGGRMRTVRVFHKALVPGDRHYVYTDGISAGFRVDDSARLSAGAACEAIMAAHAQAHDDATILVTDILEAEPA